VRVRTIVLRDTAERLDDPGLPIRSPTGDPGERIVEVAGSEGHDLVVVGNKRDGGGDAVPADRARPSAAR
jgi:nucleotide-binding universal stress UspA family protein